jgi:hypothetical protein
MKSFDLKSKLRVVNARLHDLAVGGLRAVESP